MRALLYISVAVLLTTVTVCLGHYHKHHMCPPPFGMKSFDIDRFQGDWYVVSQYINKPFAPEGKMCLELSYSPAGDVDSPDVEITVRIKNDDELKDLEMRCAPAGPPGPHGNRSGASLCVLKLNHTDWHPTLQQQILSTDYSTFAVTQSCLVFYDRDQDDFRRMLVVNVLSREPSMPEQKLQLLKSVASSGEADIDMFRDIDNGDC